MNLRELIVSALLLGIGTVLHALGPKIAGMTPDLILAMMFLAILLFPNVRNVLLVSIVSGILAALTTGFPMGEIASLIEKPIAAFVFFGLFTTIKKLIDMRIGAVLLTAVCTIISGLVFLTIGLFVLKADVGAGFLSLLSIIVLPTALINAIIMGIIYPFVLAIAKRSQLIPSQ